MICFSIRERIPYIVVDPCGLKIMLIHYYHACWGLLKNQLNKNLIVWKASFDIVVRFQKVLKYGKNLTCGCLTEFLGHVSMVSKRFKSKMNRDSAEGVFHAGPLS